jgi:6-phosphogluconolactonase
MKQTISLLGLIFITLFTMPTNAAEQTLYIASAGKPGGVYKATLDLETGKISEPELFIGEVRTGFLDLHPEKPLLYVAGDDKAGGYVAAYNVNHPDKQLARVATKDKGTTHIEIGGAAATIAVCHYGGKGTTVVPVDAKGMPIQPVGQHVHTGSSVHSRQKGPHPHGVAIHKDGEYVCVADLGTDEVIVLKIGEDNALTKVSAWKAKPGAGPRHVSFHPNYKWLYCINEIDCTLATLEFDAATGKLTELQVVPTLPKEVAEGDSTAEVVVHPSGKFVYGSNRGHDSTAVFAIDQEKGTLTLVEHEATGGGHPRFVGLDPTGKIYVAANRDSDNLVTFFIDEKTGALKPTGFEAKVGRPMCIVFAP